MDKLTIYTKRVCEDCTFFDPETNDCGIANLSGFDNDWDREEFDEINDTFYEKIEPCKYNLAYYDVEAILKWFFETQTDKFEYVDED
jgi:hypothetical protein